MAVGRFYILQPFYFPFNTCFKRPGFARILSRTGVILREVQLSTSSEGLNADPARFTIRAANATIEGKGFYAAIIVESRNPLLETIIDDFENTAQALTEGKP